MPTPKTDSVNAKNGKIEFTKGGIKYSLDLKKLEFSATPTDNSATASATISLKDPSIIGKIDIKTIPGFPGFAMSVTSDGKGTFKFNGAGGAFGGTINFDIPSGTVTKITTEAAIGSSAVGAKLNLEIKPTLLADGSIKFDGKSTASLLGYSLWSRERTVTADDRSFLDLFSFAYDAGKNPLLNTFDRFKNQNGFNNTDEFKQLQELIGIFNIQAPTDEDIKVSSLINEYMMSAEATTGSSNTLKSFSDYWTGAKTDFLSVTVENDPTPVGSSTTDATASISANNTTLGSTGDYTFGSLLGNVNISRGLQAVANDLIADSFRPGNFNLSLSLPTDAFTQMGGLSLFDSLNSPLAGSLFNTSSQNLFNWTPTDPLVLDLNGDGVRLTNFTDGPVLFDADNDGGSKEQTGWVSPADGIVVHDLNGDGQINNISETLSEYYKGQAGSNGVAGTKPYANGFKALQDLDKGNGTVGSAGYGDGIFDSRDAAWANLRVWVDANHDGNSWIDTNNNGIKEATETTTELQTFAALGITQINLSNTAQSGEVRDGNEVLARGSFVQNGLPREAVAANFLNNPAGSTLTQSSNGVTAALDGSAIKSHASTNTSSTVNEALSTATLGVQNVTGGAGNDTLMGDAQANWLAGGLGADVFNAGAGDDVILVDAKDLANAAAINGGDGLDMVQVIGSEGVNLNMSASNVEIAVGNIGNDVIIGGDTSLRAVKAMYGRSHPVLRSPQNRYHPTKGASCYAKAG